MAFAAGDTSGRYEIVAPIGAGGVGEVFRVAGGHLANTAIEILPRDSPTAPFR